MDSSRNVANFLYCSSILEETTYQMYYELSQKVDHPIIRSWILSIAHDSLKHSSLLREISKDIMVKPPKEKDCKKGFGETWKNNLTLSKEISGKVTLDSKSLARLAKKLAFFEYSLTEEYTTLVQLQTLQYMDHEIYKSYGVDLEDVKGVFESIINDEKKHRETLVEITKLLTEEEAKTNNTPKIKYQTPDAWYPPPRR